MSGAERAEKKRRKASLFPAKAATLRENDAERKRKAPSDESAQRDAVKEAEALEAGECEEGWYLTDRRGKSTIGSQKSHFEVISN